MGVKPSVVIGISGGSGSGKTSFIKAIEEQFSDDEVCIISQDNYYLKREEQHTDENGIKNFDLPESIDPKRLLNDLQLIMQGQDIEITEYVFNNELRTAKTIAIHSAPVVLIEGLFIYHFEELKDAFDYKIFINAKDNLKVIRRIKRDQIERNYPLDDVLYRYEYHVMPSFEKYILPYKEDCDIVVNNNDDFKGPLDIVSGFISSKLPM